MPNIHIMIIEDDAEIQEFLILLLSNNGYTTSSWSTSTQAVEQVVQHQPDLVVLDHRLGSPPDGWTIFNTLHGLLATAHIPVIICSAEPSLLRVHSDEIRAMHSDVLEKPFMPNQLLEKIEALTLSSNER